MAGVLKVGLTGGIACGRSAAAGFLAGPGWLILDADKVAHALLAEGGGGVEPVVETFGAAVLREGGGIDRGTLARVVFADADARRRLERILHPLILGVIDADIASFEARAGEGIVVVDAALMVETGSYRRYHRLVVVHCPLEVQRERLVRRDRLSPQEADARIAAQAPLEAKIAVADYLIDTGGFLDRTREETMRVKRFLEEDLRALPLLAPRRPGAIR